MKSIKYILAISLSVFSGQLLSFACGSYEPFDACELVVFRACSPELRKQWRMGQRFQEFEKEQNCLLWQRITSTAIPYDDIMKVIYDIELDEFKNRLQNVSDDNKFINWLSNPSHRDDADYVTIAKEIENIREYMLNPWYYPYDGDDEHQRLDSLLEVCRSYSRSRHKSRYDLQMFRLLFAQGDYQACVRQWESSSSVLPQDIITDMIASYAGGAYYRCDNRAKAIELYTRSGDIGSLISLKAWDDTVQQSQYTDKRVKELEYIFNQFPNSPLLSIRVQEYVKDRIDFIHDYNYWKAHDFRDPVMLPYNLEGDSIVVEDVMKFYDQFKCFARNAAKSPACHQKGMWNYALAYLHYLDEDFNRASSYLALAQRCKNTPLIDESLRVFRILLDSRHAVASSSYKAQLLDDLKWIDKNMERDVTLDCDDQWQYDNKVNRSVNYWQDVVRHVLLGEICPRLQKCGDIVLSLQLANYATNRIYQLSPMVRDLYWSYCSCDPNCGPEWYYDKLNINDYRRYCYTFNPFDYSSKFFEYITGLSADQAAQYVTRVMNPQNETDRFLNPRGYTDPDYLNEIVGTLYIREMKYDKAVKWLSRVSQDYQRRTNLDKEEYFNLDPFKFHNESDQYIADSSDYKLKFAQEMMLLEQLFNSDGEVNRKADAKMRYAIGLRNSFGRCWSLTTYGIRYDEGNCSGSFHYRTTNSREQFSNNPYAQTAYSCYDKLMEEAIAEYTDDERAAAAQLELLNFETIVTKYPNTMAAQRVRSQCDNYHDYAIHRM